MNQSPHTLLLSYQPPWQWQQFHAHFALRALAGVESLQPHSYARSVLLEDQPGWFRVQPLADQHALQLHYSESLQTCLATLTARVRKMFDLDCQPQQISAHFANDTQLGPLVARNPGLRLPAAFEPFEQAVRAIVGQQVTVKAAVTITGRLVTRLGESLQFADATDIQRLFPTAAAIADANLDGIGMPGKRVQTLQHFAGQVASGALRLDLQNGYTAFVEQLCALPGIGPWTAEYIALRAFGEVDAFPASDLGLLKAPVWGPEGIDAKQLKARAEAWRPWRAYAAAHLWHNYSEG
ncbi:MAG: 3-methyladenine DNA glycosylase 2 [Pseudomonas sp.]|uniref:DNA-3-methyladenine glycosylase family protein n=1 Tax=Pseudomonas sp. FEMGT703P TaxID=2080764 RepID=UPI000CA9C2BE|nr:DNA-3-methyladenine glycosylase [Pseudomonas sp. FEMGT703P]PJE39730.1 MAG: 3-methyladenine DNA glycosylase 2 [Pseudomonas sp.] [Pseudomonas sp. FEMGT703P]